MNKGETPFAVLRFAHLFDGNHFVEEIDNFDVRFRLKLAINLLDIIQLHDLILMCFSPCFSLNFLKDGTEQWKAQQLFRLLFSDQNTIEPSKMGDEITKIYDNIKEKE